MGKADLHSHTKYSGMTKVVVISLPDSVTEPVELARAAERRGLDVLCVTDHNSIKGAVKVKQEARSVEVVMGEEVGAVEGEVIGLFISEMIPKGLSAGETIDRIHSLGGLAIAPHPFSAHCSSLGKMVFDLPLDGIEVFNAAHRDRYSNQIAQKLCEGSKKALTGGSDAHGPAMVGDAYTTFDGSTGEDLRKAILQRRTNYGGSHSSLRNLVWMTTNTALEMQDIIKRSVFTDDPPDDTDYAEAIYGMRRISKIVSFMGIMAFLAPPATVLAGLIGDRVHRSNSKAMWEQMNRGTG